MKNTICIKRSELQQQIDLKNYYMGESAKRKDIDADTIQSCKDDEELLCMLIRRGCNELVSAVALRFPYISFEIDDENILFTFETDYTPPAHLLPLLQQAIAEYIANDTGMHWLLIRRPEMAQTYVSLRLGLYNNVQQLFAKIYNRKKTRRRSTDLAGI
ncbi:MAG: hypothetical protein IJY44_04305 [Bacteroidaceae bacterium]|nr:hypothetical protein [Bacteroidaceae bacterium]